MLFFDHILLSPKVICTIFEDKKRCLDLARAPKIRSRTKHIALKYHHFKSHIGKTISIRYIETAEQIADIFTKALKNSQFYNLIKQFTKEAYCISCDQLIFDI